MGGKGIFILNHAGFYVIHRVVVDLRAIKKINIELDDTMAPETVRSFLDCLPLEVGINVWGEELYTDMTQIKADAENSKSLVDLMDVAYWPRGRAICLFFGPTPIGARGEIRPYSPVNVIGKIVQTDKGFIRDVSDGTVAEFRLG